ncbi:MAG: hypothetical protein CMN32_01950 [Saprospirales bacterium]|nr:hypothetical protein [Saprospirales bacterium]
MTNILRQTFLAFFLLVFAFSASGQNNDPAYTVQIGTFVNPKPEDFKSLQTLGFVYAVPQTQNQADIFIGGFTDQLEAEKLAETLRSPQYGFANARMVELNTEGGHFYTMVQLEILTAGKEIDWEPYLQLGRIYVVLEDKMIKVYTGIFPDKATANGELPRIRAAGFKDAFVKDVNNVLLHEIGDFEIGPRKKKPLIPLNFDRPPAEQPVVETKKETQPAEVVVAQPEMLTSKGVEETPPAPPANKPAVNLSATLPDIRANVKRQSAIELQKVLKTLGTYSGKADGYYGPNTRAAYDRAVANNRQLKKYRILARYYYAPANTAKPGTVQWAINSLWEDSPAALEVLKQSSLPVAKAYRAYFEFVTKGPGATVNDLMNSAIKQAFANVKSDFPRFDPSATYAYVNIEQLILHLRYVQQVSPQEVEAPCWLFSKHPGPALNAFSASSQTLGLHMQNCGGFWDWEEVQLLHAIAQDIGAADHPSHSSTPVLASYFLNPQAPDAATQKELKQWNATLWSNLNAWSSRDPMFTDMVNALKITWFQTQVLLEDYYMNYGLKAEEATALALATIKAIAGEDLKRFM